MSLITHACRCGHPVIMHALRHQSDPTERCSTTTCDCLAPSEDFDAAGMPVAMVLETFTVDRQPTPLTPPGSHDPFGQLRLTCQCPACHSFFAAATGTVEWSA